VDDYDVYEYETMRMTSMCMSMRQCGSTICECVFDIWILIFCVCCATMWMAILFM
jgi:hypothetical protein